MHHATRRALAAVALVPLALSLAPLVPEKPLMSRAALEKTATHVVVGEVQRVYTVVEKTPGWRTTHSIAQILVEDTEKAPDAATGEALEGTLVYARWFVRRDTRIMPRPGGSGHHGWTPERGDRVRAYLARNAYDGFVRAEHNSDGGYNAIVPNGFEELEAGAKDR